MTDQWFSYDPDDGFETHETEQEARARVDAVFADERAMTEGGGWRDPDELLLICYGRIVGGVVMVSEEVAAEGEFKGSALQDFAVREIGNVPTGLGLGSDGLRDPEFPCEEFARGFPKDIAPAPNCEGDGHYLCQECQFWIRGEVLVEATDEPDGFGRGDYWTCPKHGRLFAPQCMQCGEETFGPDARDPAGKDDTGCDV